MARPGKRRLTPKGILQLKQEGYYADSEAVGLYVQVAHRQQDGKRDKKHGITRSWIYRYTSPVTKKVRWMGLGPCDAITLGDKEITEEDKDGKKKKIVIAGARSLARAARHLVSIGIDPIEAREARGVAERQAYLKEQASKMTFAMCVEQYLPKKLKKYRNAKHKWQWRETLGRASKAFGDLNVGAIDDTMVIKFLTPIWDDTPETANRIRGRIEQVLDWARVHKFRSGDNPARWAGHLEYIFTDDGERGHYKPMPYEQIPAFMDRLRQRDSVVARALELQILTAARPGEVRLATWDEIDLDQGLWNRSAEHMKAHKAHIVPLSKQAIALLEKLPTMGPHVFPGREAQPLSDAAVRKMFKKLDANGYDVHAFRSSFKDWSGDESIFDDEVSEHALAHAIENKVKAAYRRRSALRKRRLLMQSWADYCDGVVDKGNVHQLHA